MPDSSPETGAAIARHERAGEATPTAARPRPASLAAAGVTPRALGLAFLVTVANHVWARRRPGRGMGRQEILVVYVLLAIGGPLVSLGVMQWFPSCSLGAQHYVHTMPQWENALFRDIPAWFHLSLSTARGAGLRASRLRLPPRLGVTGRGPVVGHRATTLPGHAGHGIPVVCLMSGRLPGCLTRTPTADAGLDVGAGGVFFRRTPPAQ